MVQEISDKLWQAEARTAETKKFIRDIKRITRRRFTAEEKVCIVLGGWEGAGYGFRPLTSSTGPLGKLQRDGVRCRAVFCRSTPVGLPTRLSEGPAHSAVDSNQSQLTAVPQQCGRVCSGSARMRWCGTPVTWCPGSYVSSQPFPDKP